VTYDTLPINFNKELLNLIKDYFLGKWMFTNPGSFGSKMYGGIVKHLWKMA